MSKVVLSWNRHEHFRAGATTIANVRKDVLCKVHGVRDGVHGLRESCSPLQSVAMHLMYYMEDGKRVYTLKVGMIGMHPISVLMDAINRKSTREVCRRTRRTLPGSRLTTSTRESVLPSRSVSVSCQRSRRLSRTEYISMCPCNLLIVYRSWPQNNCGGPHA